jgi:hypothetical protein
MHSHREIYRDAYWRVGGTGPLVRVEAYDRRTTPRYDVYALMGAACFGAMAALFVVSLMVVGR